jgi:hypothetical protein
MVSDAKIEDGAVSDAIISSEPALGFEKAIADFVEAVKVKR